MTEAQVKTLLAVGCLVGEVLQVARGDETLGHPLEDNTQDHHVGYGVQAQDAPAVDEIAGGHAEGRDGHPRSWRRGPYAS